MPPKNDISEEISLNFLTKFISSFDGDSKKIHSFIKNCDYAYNLANNQQKPIIFAFIQTQVTDKADLVTSCRILETWPEYKSFLLENFTENKSFFQIQLELQSCIQNRNESVINFTQRIEKCFSNLIRITKSETNDPNELIGRNAIIKQMTLHQFLIGINQNYSTVLRSQNPKTFEEASNIAINEEKLSQYKNFANSNNSNQSSLNSLNYQYKNSQVNNSNQSFQSHNNKYKESRINHVKNYTPNNNRSNFQIDKSCNYCKKKGHILSECRKLAYNNQLKNNATLPNSQNSQNNLN